MGPGSCRRTACIISSWLGRDMVKARLYNHGGGPGVGDVAVAPDGAGLVCTISHAESDVWVVESFD